MHKQQSRRQERPAPKRDLDDCRVTSGRDETVQQVGCQERRRQERPHDHHRLGDLDTPIVDDRNDDAGDNYHRHNRQQPQNNPDNERRNHGPIPTAMPTSTQ